MNDHYEITRHDTGDNLIHIHIKLNDDGGITVSDYCVGTASEMFFGHDDVESYATLGPDAVGKLYQALTGLEAVNPARDLAVWLQSTKHGDTKMQSWLRNKCDELGIPYDWEIWP